MTLQCKIIKIYILTMRTKNYQSGTRHQKKVQKIQAARSKVQFCQREIFIGLWRRQTPLEILGALSAGSRVTIPARYVRTCRRQSCWPSWPFAVRPRFIAGRDLGSRPLVPNVGLVGFLLLLGRLHCYGLLGHSYCSTAVLSARLLLG